MQTTKAQLQAWALIKFTADNTVSSYFISSSDDDKYNGTYRICLKTLFEIMWPDIYRSSILFLFEGEGEEEEVELEICLTFHLLISLCMQTTKTLKRLFDYAFDQALLADICSIVFMK